MYISFNVSNVSPHCPEPPVSAQGGAGVLTEPSLPAPTASGPPTALATPTLFASAAATVGQSEGLLIIHENKMHAHNSVFIVNK